MNAGMKTSRRNNLITFIRNSRAFCIEPLNKLFPLNYICLCMYNTYKHSCLKLIKLRRILKILIYVMEFKRKNEIKMD